MESAESHIAKTISAQSGVTTDYVCQIFLSLLELLGHKLLMQFVFVCLCDNPDQKFEEKVPPYACGGEGEKRALHAKVQEWCQLASIMRSEHAGV
eukprot:1155748-Pelagomonas_calceolata.AAC.2